MKLDKISLQYLKEAYNELKLVFATKDLKKLELLLQFYIEHRSKIDPNLNEKRWRIFLLQKYKERMRNMDVFEYNFKPFEDCHMFVLSRNIVALRAKDGDKMAGEKFLYFHRDSMGTWAWCQNEDILDHEDPELIDQETLYQYKKAL